MGPPPWRHTAIRSKKNFSGDSCDASGKTTPDDAARALGALTLVVAFLLVVALAMVFLS